MSCFKTLLDEGRSEPCEFIKWTTWTVAAKYYTRKPPSIRSIDTYVDLRGGMKYENILFGERRGGGGKGVVPSFSLKVTRGKKKKRGAGGQRNKITTSMVVKVILTLQ